MEALFLYRSMEKQTKEQFIEKARLVHNNKYDYSKVNYINSKTKVEIICPIHGSFFQAPIKHTSSKQGCPKCANEENGKRCRKSFEGFIKRAKSVHGNKYDYSKVNYINSSTKVEIVCPKHGSFFQSPNNHYKYGCPKCYRSLGEEKVAALLSENNIKFEEQKKFPDCVDKAELPFDFFLPEFNTCIEYQGEQHFKPVKWFGGEDGFKYTKRHDDIKKKFCEKNNIKLIQIRGGRNRDLTEIVKAIKIINNDK